GSAGNPRAIGSRITVKLSDETSRNGELRAGAGYLSQSPPLFTLTAPAGVTPTAITVRWPDGTSTRSPFGKRVLNVTIRKP
ncbi:MAG: ASPIC/UnbV domain-containing protein, partial [Verrucomicrobiota bacterium]|nr:ASPIC/UnbV domain-containing protein [Verrucomicrobiota bacterium]